MKITDQTPHSAILRSPAPVDAGAASACDDTPDDDTMLGAIRFASKRDINEIIVHCSATRPDQAVTAADVRRWHTRERGFADIGYHFVIETDGRIACGRPLDKIGAHCRGHNSRSVGVCYMGGIGPDGKPADTRTPRQKRSLLALLKALVRAFPAARIRSHRDFAAKACPCFDATAEYADLPPG